MNKNDFLTPQHNAAHPLKLGWALVLVLVLMMAGCGSDDTSAAAASCTFQSDCALGYVCNFEEKCIQTSCENCQDPSSGLICLKTEQNPEGTCSSPECTSDDECDVFSGETCQGGVCTEGGTSSGSCNGDDDCAEDEVCDLTNQCVPKTDGNLEPECTTTSECGSGKYCDTTAGTCADGDCADSTECDSGQSCNANHQCVDDSSDACGGCPTGQTCNETTSQCEDGGGSNCGGGCPTGQTCNSQTNQCEPNSPAQCNPACASNEICNNGTCVENTCPPGSQTPETCAQDPVYNKFDAQGCYCAECLSDADCDGAAGETCTPNGECMACAVSCDPSQGSDACGQEGFFCINECCVECTGNSDCSVAGEVCVDGTCAPPPSCANDPSVCSGGTVCNGTVCAPPQTGASCSGPMDCFPAGQCVNGQCETTGGGPGAGLPGMCTADTDCATGEVCAFGVMCVPGCPSDCMVCIGGSMCMF